MNRRERIEALLGRVERPSRYLGTEWNSVHKAPSGVDLRIALAFPDLYDLGLGNLGLHILYHVLNRLPGVWAERVYAPAPDLEGLLRAEGLELFALESRDPLHAFDAVGFSLQSELTYTNLLTMLELGGIPLRSEDRREGHPLVFAGGPTAWNPEPLAPFVDFFVFGDGEEVIVEIAAALREHAGRRARLEAISRIPGVYVPASSPVVESSSGLLVPAPGRPLVRRRVIEDLDRAPFPTDLVVPFTPLVHDHLSLEVLRGCTHGCRFCQAGATTRPVREREVSTVLALMDEALARTGYEELSLLSLSTVDHSRVRELVSRVAERARETRTSVNLPSLRLDRFSVELAEWVSDVRRTGLTLAPETATPRMRALVNKWIGDGELLAVAAEAWGRGWDRLKFYFMVGLPGETDEDVEAIARLSLKVLHEGLKRNRRAQLKLGVSAFVPKPFTPLQWAPQALPEEVRRKHEILLGILRRERRVRFSRHDPDESWLEGVIGRGDRRLAEVLERAQALGCRLDAWREHRRMGLWHRAFEQAGVDPQPYLAERDPAEPLPWDFVDSGVSREWLAEEWSRARAGEHRGDCRDEGCWHCGVIDQLPALCGRMLRRSRQGRGEDTRWPAPPPPPPEPPSAQRLLLKLGREGPAALLSHREFSTAWFRALRRARFPLSYSQGFHAHPRLSFASALPVGEASRGDYAELLLRRRLDPAEAEARLREQLPRGFLLFGLVEAPLGGPSLAAELAGLRWEVELPAPPAELEERLSRARQGPLRALRRDKRGRPLELDLAPMLAGFRVLPAKGGGSILELCGQRHGQRLPRLAELLAALDLGEPRSAHRADCLAIRDGRLVSLGEPWFPSAECRGGEGGPCCASSRAASARYREPETRNLKPET